MKSAHFNPGRTEVKNIYGTATSDTKRLMRGQLYNELQDWKHWDSHSVWSSTYSSVCTVFLLGCAFNEFKCVSLQLQKHPVIKLWWD
jgi:hypothetical protein